MDMSGLDHSGSQPLPRFIQNHLLLVGGWLVGMVAVSVLLL